MKIEIDPKNPKKPPENKNMEALRVLGEEIEQELKKLPSYRKRVNKRK